MVAHQNDNEPPLTDGSPAMFPHEECLSRRAVRPLSAIVGFRVVEDGKMEDARL